VERVDNITDWAVAQFVGHYGGTAATAAGEAEKVKTGKKTPSPSAVGSKSQSGTPSPQPSPHRGEGAITKDAIFAYVYVVLHNPVYREKYALNLKREFPRIPFYSDFARWVAWGEQLLKLHIGYEDVTPFAVTRVDVPSKRAKGTTPKPKLKSDAAAGVVVIDEDTQLTGIPKQAWDYRLGNRSAIDWVLDQHKEKTPRDPTIAAKFNTYRFADYKESCIALLAKLVAVSVETVTVTEAMRTVARDAANLVPRRGLEPPRPCER
jgi:Type ISP C-terminal specificity domain